MLPSGKIIINNKYISKNYNFMRNFGNIGYCSHNTYLLKILSKRILYLSNKKFDQVKYKQSIKIAQCNSFIKNNIKSLSGGEKQRVGIARASIIQTMY